MGRKTGKDTKIEVEIGTTFYSMAALSTVTSPSGDVGKIFTTSATYLSDQENLQPDVRLDGVISGFSLSVGSGFNEVDYSAGKAYIKGGEISVTAGTVEDLLRPLVSGNVQVTALTVDSDGNITKTAGTEGATSTSRGEAGAKPYLPSDEALIGYVTMTYYAGSASGAKLVVSSEIDNETKERTIIPSYAVLYHDGDRDNQTDAGAIEFAAAIPLIHGAGLTRRNIYASYYDATFEQMNDVKDFSFSEDVASIKSKAYGEKTEQSVLGTESWSGSGSAYWDKVQDILNLIKNSKRWVKYYPDEDETAYWAGRGIIKISRNLPTGETLNASITIDGSGTLYDKAS
jgi:hypothetical protein